MKFLLTITLLMISSVSFLYYLLTNRNFLPYDNLGDINILNIIVFTFLSITTLFSFFSILLYIANKILKKEESRKERIIKSIKISSVTTLFLLFTLLLHFFHILSFAWGLPILIIVLLLLFVI